MQRLQGIASGLLGMGILEGFHAVSSPDHGFVLLRSAASLLGGVAFSFVWHPPRMIGRRTRALMPYLVGGGTIAFGLLVVTMPHRLPRFTEQAQFRADGPRGERARRLPVLRRRGRLLDRVQTDRQTGAPTPGDAGDSLRLGRNDVSLLGPLAERLVDLARRAIRRLRDCAHCM